MAGACALYGWLEPAQRASYSLAKVRSAEELCAILTLHALPPSTAFQDTFFKKLPNLLPSIPTPVAQRKLLPMLANAIEFGGAPPVSLECCGTMLVHLVGR